MKAFLVKAFLLINFGMPFANHEPNQKLMKYILIFLSSLFVFASCEVIDETDIDTDNTAEGLKEALKVGTDTAVSQLNVIDGYFGDALLKILLPSEVDDAISSFRTKSFNVGFSVVTGEEIYTSGNATLGIASLKEKEDDLILGINRAAEAAAEQASPIFVSAITAMTISDANDILFGSDSAATEYLENNTRTELFMQYEPKLDSALNVITVGGKSVTTLYEEYVQAYNDVLNTSLIITTVGDAINLSPIESTDLSDHATNKALDGLFTKVAEEEQNIRQNPLARVTDLLSDVFGRLD